MKKKSILILFLTGLSAFSQTKTIDSLQKILNVSEEDTSKVDVINELAWEYVKVDPAIALDFSLKAAQLSASLNYSRGLFLSKRNKANALTAIGDYSKAKEIYTELIDYQVKAKNLRELAKLYNNMANLENHTGDFKSNIDYLIRALTCADQLNDQSLKRIIYKNIGNNYANRNEHKKALEFYEKALASRDVSAGSRNDYGSIYEGIGLLLIQQKKYKEALANFSIAETCYKEDNNTYNLAGLCSNIAFYYIELNDNLNARLYTRKAVLLYSRASQPSDMIICLITLSATYFNEVGALPPAKASQYRDSTLLYLDSALRIADRYNLKSDEMDIYQRKSQLFANMGRFDSAFITFHQYIEIRDSLRALEQDKQIHEITTRYGVDLKEKENLLLSSENNAQKFIIAGLVFLFLIVIALAVLIARQNKLKALQQTMQLEQKLLRSQMNPHFIFNALQAIQNYILKHDQKEAVKYLSSFANITRSVLENSRMELIPLHKEITLLDNYLQLQKLRFGNRFEYSIHLDTAIDTAAVEIPPMLSQPFIENAIEHGMRDIESGGKIEVSFSLKDQALQLEITDNGAGMQTDNISQKQHQSMALAITNERVALMNKKKSHKTLFSISDAFPESAERKGVKVKFSIPLQHLSA